MQSDCIMNFSVNKSNLRGSVDIPGSKSHTIRAVLLASIAEGESRLIAPLSSALGAKFDRQDNEWIIEGTGGKFKHPKDILDVANSGTTLRVALGSLSLLNDVNIEITGDHQIQSRPCQALLTSLSDLGANINSVRDNGSAPFIVKGGLKGGKTSIECKTSQYLTSLLLACPLAEHDSEIIVPLLHEKPYAVMTIDWLKFMGIELEYNDDLSHFHIPGRQTYKRFERKIPADFSTATFFIAAGALGDNTIISKGLDMSDSQADKAVVDYLKKMGASIEVKGDEVHVSASELTGVDIDMNDSPDALPMMAVTACFAKGTTRLLNVPQARIKETDRIAVMCQELRKMGADIEELEDGLVIRESKLHAAELDGHHDHRVVMSLSIAGMMVDGQSTISTAEAASVTVPQFADFMKELGADIQLGS